MENLDLNDDANFDEDEEEEKGAEAIVHESSHQEVLSIESISIDPTFILNKAFQKVTAVGSSTALVAIRN
jgi:hypothetical protein